MRLPSFINTAHCRTPQAASRLQKPLGRDKRHRLSIGLDSPQDPNGMRTSSPSPNLPIIGAQPPRRAEWHGSQPDYILLMGDAPTLYEWAGGRDAFDRLIDAFYDRVEQDELLSPLFPGGVHEEHRRNVATWWSEVFGGPSDYTDRIGGYERMVGRHLQLRITNDQRFRFVSLMSLAADDANLPSDPEFRSALVAYLEWGTRLALGNSQTGAEVVEHAPVPRWGWGEAPPYQP